MINRNENYCLKLLMSDSRVEEDMMKEEYKSKGYDCFVTLISGLGTSLEEKILYHSIKAGVHSSLIAECPYEIELLVHALEDAMKGIKFINSDMKVKVAALGKNNHLVVSVYCNKRLYKQVSKPFIGMGTALKS
ncbi:HutP family protein [Acidaminobacter sp. JC074]|uniref:HutP family protein n=1 Tax=Acidaminobacter sp. JC074 TaxID=2530199 RepID=UPI001F0ED3ED|nr:HutP family protein [Acidaminobacter sp. JC074]